MLGRIGATIFLIFVLGPTADAQNTVNSKINLSRPYWLNYSVIFFEGCQPKISHDKIIFNAGTCRVNAYAGEIFSRGTKVRISALSKSKGFTKVRFRYWPEIYEWESEYEILLDSDSNRTLRKSFDLLFSTKKTSNEYHCPDNLRTRRQIIQCLGFPIEIKKEGDIEKYFYILEFTGPNPFSSFDGFWIEIKKGRFINVSGYI